MEDLLSQYFGKFGGVFLKTFVPVIISLVDLQKVVITVKVVVAREEYNLFELKMQ